MIPGSLLGKRFIIRTDHKALQWLMDWWCATISQYHNWIGLTSTYDFVIEHRAGKNHGNADLLSRIPCDLCEQCELAHLNPMKKRNVKIIRHILTVIN